MAYPTTLVFVHGWSVAHTNTYGGLPQRLAAESAAAGHKLKVRDLRLAKYVSFHDEVRVEDLARAMESAVRRELADLLAAGERFAVITHSTGGPIAREWWWRHYVTDKSLGACPMSHLIMLAPANFGSALAQLGKGRISRMKSWTEGVEPGTGVLDWLEHGSHESWRLNEAWIRGRFGKPSENGVFSFVLTGQTIDRSLYDHLNAYTGESGSDGVVRVPAANLNASLLRLEQGTGAEAGALIPSGRTVHAPATAFRIMTGRSHSGEDKGIMNAVEPKENGDGIEVTRAIQRCLAVADAHDYDKLSAAFAVETERIQAEEKVEIQVIPILPDRAFVHDRTSLVIFRIKDSEGYPLHDFDLELTGLQDDPDLLPEGFFNDRQRNQRSKNVLTFFFNYDLMVGSAAIPDPREKGRVLRPALLGVDRLGLRITPRPSSGFVHYQPCSVAADPQTLRAFIQPNQTTMVDVVLRRLVHREVFELERADAPRASFKKIKPGDELIG